MDIKKIKNVVSIIFLGALGSGLWGLLGEPTAGFIYNSVQQLGGSFSILFNNFINTGIGSGGWEDRGSLFFLIVFIFSFGAFSIRFVSNMFETRSIIFVFTCVMSIFCLAFGYKVFYAHKISLYFQKNIEILTPYVTLKETQMARAHFREIDDFESFVAAQEYLLDLANSSNRKINKFSL